MFHMGYTVGLPVAKLTGGVFKPEGYAAGVDQQNGSLRRRTHVDFDAVLGVVSDVGKGKRYAAWR
jgi:hypothetical protein